MRERISVILPIAVLSLCLVFTSFLVDVEYSVVSSDIFASVWVFITNTGGTIGSGLLTLVASSIIAVTYKSVKRTSLNLGVLVVMFAIIFIGVAQLNEHFIKEKIMAPRPNIVLLSKDHSFSIDDLYAFHSKKERTQYLSESVKTEADGGIYLGDLHVKPIVWKHWLKETGYSFPSGHSVNAFLMAFIMSYFFLIRFKKFGKYGVLSIYFWAVLIVYSRLLLGVHSNLDVSLGALWGSLLGMGIVSTGIIDYISNKIIIGKN